MVKKQQKNSATKKTDAPLSGSVKDSAQQIWQAGLGAFNKVQAEGSKAFEALVKEGVSLQRKTQSAAEEKLSQASHKMANMASDISSKASGQWDKLEGIFEERVAKALDKLGAPSAQDIRALSARVDALHQSVQQLLATRAAPKTAAKARVTAPAVAKSASRVRPKAGPKTAPQAAAKATTKKTPKPT